MTIEGVSAYAAEHISQKEIEEAMSEIKRCWNEDHRYMLTPSFLLNLIVKHTGMVHSMLSIYFYGKSGDRQKYSCLARNRKNC